MRKNQFLPTKNKSRFQQLITDQPQNRTSSSDISQDPDYQLMLAESQQGHWNDCRHLIAGLEEKYPGNSKIAEFKQDFELQQAILTDIGLSAKDYRKKKFLHYLKNLVILAGILVGAFLITWYVSKTSVNNYREKQLQENAIQINNLSVQVEGLLNSGQPEKAQEIVQKMVAIDPASPKTIELSQKTETLLRINNLYLDAVDKLNNGLDSEALSLLMQIESEYPGYQDVPQLIKSTDSKIKIAQALSAGTEAYNAGNWQDAIDNYEQVLTIDPGNSTTDLKGMLVTSYLRRVPQLLENDNPNLQDIDQAGVYYSRANALIPQLKANSSELENLKRQSANLLEQKFTQTADQMIKDPAQTSDSVNQAYTYLEKALSLDPQNSSLQAEIGKMDLYRTGFKFYIDQDWQSAIQQLTTLLGSDEGYANGLARQILYEAYISQGIQYYSAGSYLEARNEYESAGTLTLDKGNRLDFYLAEINLGLTLGKLNLYDEADSTFITAIQSIDYEQSVTASDTFISGLGNAVTLYKNGQYEESYNLFNLTLGEDNGLYEIKKIDARQGNCLALIAAYYQSSVQAIIEQNNLPQQTIVTSDQTLLIPVIP